MTTATVQTFLPSVLSHDEASSFLSAHKLPEPSSHSVQNFTTQEILGWFFTDFFVLAAVKRLHENPDFDDQLLVDVLAACMVCDDQSYTMFNAMTLLEHFHAAGNNRRTTPQNFAYAVSGLSQHNGATGSASMHRLVTPADIHGAAAVVAFIETMDTNHLVKFAKLKHPDNSGCSGMTITNGYLDRFLRSNPNHFEAICNYLEKNLITATKKSVQPLIDSLS